MPGLLGVVRPRWPHLPLGRSRQAGLDMLGHSFFENLLTHHGPSHTSILLRVAREAGFRGRAHPTGCRGHTGRTVLCDGGEDGPARVGGSALASARNFVDGCATIPVTASIADDAASLKARHRALSLPDAIALVVAELIDADAVWTFDRRWSGVDPRVIFP